MLILAVVPLVFLVTFAVAFVTVAVARVALAHKAAAGAGGTEATLPAQAETPLLLKEDKLSTISVWDRLLAQFDFAQLLRVRLAEAGLNWSVGRTTALMLLCATVGAAVLGNLSWAHPVLVLGGAVLAACLPYFYILRARAKRFGRFGEQFPEALDSLCRALRAGHPLAAAVELLAAESPEPIATEMRILFDEWKLGLGWEQALDNLARRVPLLDVAVFVAAVKLQSRAGGRLNEVLTKLADSMRESSTLESEIRSISAHGRLTGLVLSLVPVAITLAMLWVNPGHFRVLTEHPMGRYLIGAAVVCLALAHIVIRKLVDIRI
jgi:tight adherence protein B